MAKKKRSSLKQICLKGVVLLVLSGLISCSNKSAVLEGSWQACKEGEVYAEFHFRGDSFRIASDVMKASEWETFTMNGDTMSHLAVRYSYMEPTERRLRQAIVTVLPENRLRLEYINPHELWDISRIDSPKEGLDDTWRLYDGAKARAKAMPCLGSDTFKKQKTEFEF